MGNKKWFKSKAIWAGIIGSLIGIIKIIDTNFGTDIMNSTTITLAMTIFSVLGLYGRKTATTIIK